VGSLSQMPAILTTVHACMFCGSESCASVGTAAVHWHEVAQRDAAAARADCCQAVSTQYACFRPCVQESAAGHCGPASLARSPATVLARRIVHFRDVSYLQGLIKTLPSSVSLGMCLRCRRQCNRHCRSSQPVRTKKSWCGAYCHGSCYIGNGWPGHRASKRCTPVATMFVKVACEQHCVRRQS
jgi:hypothetical protein